MNYFEIHKELKAGGKWLGAARRWMQNNIRKGDELPWSSRELVSIPFTDLEGLALSVATSAVAEERQRVAKLINQATAKGES